MNAADERPSGAAELPRRVSAAAVGRAAWLLALVGTFVSPPLANAGVAIALLCIVASPELRRRVAQIARTRVALACAAFVAWMLISTLWSRADWTHRISAVFDWRTLLVLLVGFVLFSEERHKRQFAFAFVSIAGTAALFVLFSWATGIWPLTHYTPGLLFRNWVTQTMTFGAAALTATGLLFDRDEAALAGRAAALRRFWLGLALLALLASIASISIGRSAVLLLVSGVIVLALHARQTWTRWSLPALLVVGVIAAVSGNTLMKHHVVSGVQELSAWQTAEQPTSGGMRVHFWVNTLATVQERPWFGYGAGGLAPAVSQHVAQHHQGWRAAPIGDPHNQYLRVLGEYGAVGLALFLLLLASIARQSSSPPWQGLGRALLAGWMLTSLLNSHFQTFNEGHMLFLLLGAVLAPLDDALRASQTHT